MRMITTSAWCLLLLAAGCSMRKTSDRQAGSEPTAARVVIEKRDQGVFVGRFIRYEDSAIAASIFVCDSTGEVQRILCPAPTLGNGPATFENRLVRIAYKDSAILDREDSVVIRVARAVDSLPEPAGRLRQQSRGLGVIAFGDPDEETGGYLLPRKALNAFDKPAGGIEARIILAENASGERSPHLKSADALVEIDANDIQEVDDGAYAIRYYESARGFVRIAAATKPPGVWLSVAELAAGGCRPLPWQDFFISRAYAYPIATDTCITLRSSPADTAAAITRMMGDAFQIRFTGGREGPWLKAQVEQNDGYCSGATIYRTWEGWVRAVDEAGNPLVWFYPLQEQ